MSKLFLVPMLSILASCGSKNFYSAESEFQSNSNTEESFTGLKSDHVFISWDSLEITRKYGPNSIASKHYFVVEVCSRFRDLEKCSGDKGGDWEKNYLEMTNARGDKSIYSSSYKHRTFNAYEGFRTVVNGVGFKDLYKISVSSIEKMIYRKSLMTAPGGRYYIRLKFFEDDLVSDDLMFTGGVEVKELKQFSFDKRHKFEVSFSQETPPWWMYIIPPPNDNYYQGTRPKIDTFSNITMHIWVE